MYRDKGYLLHLLFMSIMTIIATGIGLLFSIQTGAIIFLTSIVLLGSTLYFTNGRYREIKKLTHYLRQMESGNYSLDIRDNQEGELSILKNEIYKVTQMLSEQSSALQNEKLKLKDAISDISHQVKTPLTSMMVMADLLSDEDLSLNKRKEFTQKLLTQIERLEWLVSSLLKLSKMDAGTIQFKKEKVMVKRLLENATQPLLIPIELKNQRISISGKDNISFIGDENWTREAILNILKNCMEHTPENGEISIMFSENALFTEIMIRDNGIGITKKDLPHIFKRFYKGQNAREGSVGIGLAMAQQIITNQNGDLEVTSTSMKGTTFRIKFYKQII
jgi:signal transduction histidine kinase